MPIETWKGLLTGTGVTVAIHLEDGVDSGAGGRRTMTHEEMRGLMASGLHRGADAVYLFNLFTGPFQRWPREHYDRLVRDATSPDTLSAGPRRHPLTLTRPWAAGEPGADSALPCSGRNGFFRIHIGPLPTDRQDTRIELVATNRDEPLEVLLNDTPCSWSGIVEAAHIRQSGWPEDQPQRQAYHVPPEALSDGYNLVEVKGEDEFEITWVEVSVQPRQRASGTTTADRRKFADAGR